VSDPGLKVRVQQRRRRGWIAVSVCTATLALWIAAVPAGAVVVKIGSHGYGVAPINAARADGLTRAYRATKAPGLSGARGARPFDELPSGGGPLEWGGGPVVHSNTTHVIYWDPNKEFIAEARTVISTFFTDVEHDSGLPSNVFGVAGQYTDGTANAAYKSTFAGAKIDEKAYPTTENCTIPNEVDKGPYTTCLFDSQLQTELKSYIAANSLAKGITQQYFVLLPHKVVTCLPQVIEGKQVCSNNFYCAYHSYIEPGTENEIIYSDIPFSLLDTFVKGCQDDGNAAVQLPNGDGGGTNETTRYADVALKYISHEFIEAITDPLPEFETAWVDVNHLEIGDKCNGVSPNAKKNGVGYDANAFTPTLGGKASENNLFNQLINSDHFYLQSEWDNGAKACTMKPAAITGAGFTSSPASPAQGSPAEFGGSASDPYAADPRDKLEFAWTFGDGGEGSGAATVHTYAATGKFTVTMTAKDSLTGSKAAAVEQFVTVKIGQTITFTSSAPSTATVGGSPYTVSATASSKLPPSFSSGTPAVCSVSGSTVSFLAAGTCTVDANQSGNGEFGSAPQAQQSFAVKAAPSTGGGGSGGGGPGRGSSVLTPSLAPNSSFGALNAAINSSTGTVTFTASVSDAGTFSWLLTFQNGRFGVFAASNAKCKKGFVKLNGKCRLATIVFGKGSKAVAAPGTMSFTIKPSASALKALKNAAKHKKGLPVKVTLTFQSALGGVPVSHTQALTVRLKTK
jgi:PKD domain-containing protein